jgi:DNA-binding response OmpR family regulator
MAESRSTCRRMTVRSFCRHPKKCPLIAKRLPLGGGARKGKSADEVFLNGITIDLTDENESITFDGETVAVSPIEAKLVKILARPRPAAVGEAFLVGNLWDKPAPRNATEQLRQLCVGDLKKGLASIGLNLTAVKGVGYQLKDA